MTSRRAFLAGTTALAIVPRAAAAADAAPVWTTIDGLAADVVARLAALGAAVPAARPLAESVRRDLARHARERRGLGAPAAGDAATSDDASLTGLRAAQESLLLAHAEGLPELRDRHAVDVVARHMVDLSRHLTVTDLWLAAEDRG